MTDTLRIKLALFSLSAALMFTANAAGCGVGHWNWNSGLSYLSGIAAGIGIFSHCIRFGRNDRHG
jgi:hypothetical protein